MSLGLSWVRWWLALLLLTLLFHYGHRSSLLATGLTREAPPAPGSHNLILFVADGLRHKLVTPERMPELFALSQAGVRFENSHSVFPTVTMANASAISSGHFLADTGIFANTLYAGFPLASSNGTLIPFLENDAVLTELDAHYDENLINGATLLSAARAAGYSTAAVGKLGPVLLQQIPERFAPNTIVIDDQTGSASGVPLPPALLEMIRSGHLSLAAPDRGDNGRSGDFREPGTRVPNLAQQRYFTDVATEVVLPYLRRQGRPFVMVYWSRDPDGTQHNQGDSLNRIIPGINGPTSLRAVRNADDNLARLRRALDSLGLSGDTDILVTSDHGFSTITKRSETSYSTRQRYSDVVPGYLPSGFLAIDLAHALGLQVFDPDSGMKVSATEPSGHSNNALLGAAADRPEIAVAPNGGSDLIYLLGSSGQAERAREIVRFLLGQDYVSGIFVDDALGEMAGTLPFSAVNLKGSTRMPAPSLLVSFRSFSSGCAEPTLCGVIVADSALQQGQGNHGSFGRQDTWNFMAGFGPDFRHGYVDPVPASNADIAVTASRLLGIELAHDGVLQGRVLSEALAGQRSTPEPAFSQQRLSSAKAANGLATVLRFQTVSVAGSDGGARTVRYFDAAGFKGRTVGLN